jgi:hypothetical protein
LHNSRSFCSTLLNSAGIEQGLRHVLKSVPTDFEEIPVQFITTVVHTVSYPISYTACPSTPPYQ